MFIESNKIELKSKYTVSVKKAVCLILDDFFAKHHFNVFRPRQIINRI